MVVIDNWMGIYAKFRKWFAGIRSPISAHTGQILCDLCVSGFLILFRILLSYDLCRKKGAWMYLRWGIPSFIGQNKIVSCGFDVYCRFALVTLCIDIDAVTLTGIVSVSARAMPCTLRPQSLMFPYLTFSVLKNLSKIFWAKNIPEICTAPYNISESQRVMANCGSIINE